MITLVTTPIGNLEDMTPRGLKALAAADIIYCEDTRHSRTLLSHFQITGKKLAALHEHNEVQQIDTILGHLQEGLNITIVSDAGMPVISDPGQRLVQAALEAGYIVTATPGPTAAMTALAISGLPSERFCFEGFLPVKGAERTKLLESIAAEPRTTILYESPHRVVKTITDLSQLCDPERIIVITRELTKLHEEVWRGSIMNALPYMETATIKGEYTLVLEGSRTVVAEVTDEQITAALSDYIAQNMTKKEAVSQVTADYKIQRRRAYQLSLIL